MIYLKNIIKGIHQGCKISGCQLVGGETAEMPGTYSKNKFDLAGFSVGIVSKDIHYQELKFWKPSFMRFLGFFDLA